MLLYQIGLKMNSFWPRVPGILVLSFTYISNLDVYRLECSTDVLSWQLPPHWSTILINLIMFKQDMNKYI